MLKETYEVKYVKSNTIRINKKIHLRNTSNESKKRSVGRNKQTNKLINKLTNKQTNKLINKQTN